jgi:hypothetical protein
MRGATLIPATLLLFVGSSAPEIAPPDIENAATIPELTAPDARRALIELAERPAGRETAAWERLDDLRMGGAIDLITPNDEGVCPETWTR